MSPARKRRREAIFGKESSLSEKAMEVLLPDQSGGPSLWGACLIDCMCSIVRVIGVATEKLQL